MISSVTKLTHLEEQLIYSWLAFAQIYKLHGYGQYKMKGNIINVLSNINQTQLLLPRLSCDEVIIGVFLKRQLECEPPYRSKNVRPNLVMLAQKDLISTPLYSNLNVTMDLQWDNLFFMHTTLFNQTNDQNISSFDDFDFENENHVICVPKNSVIHNFLDACFKINDYENIIYYIASN